MINSRTRMGLVVFLALALSVALRGSAESNNNSAVNGDWPTWGHDLSNQRYNAAETAITPANVSQLQLRWTFAFPHTYISSGQPTVIGDTVYIGSWNGHFYALDAATGKQRWDFYTAVTGKTGNIRGGAVLANNLVMFGDQLGRFFAINADNGSLAWVKQIDKHPLAQITGSPVTFGDRVYVPMASREEDASADPNYPCCTFHGSLTALNIVDGSTAWRFEAVPASLQTTQVVPFFSGPSGVGIWSTPSIDPNSKLIYVTTGNSYTPPVSPYSDAILAINLGDGSLRWARQFTANDWANRDCTFWVMLDCDEPNRDNDFGSAPLLFSPMIDGVPRELVAAEQKSGLLYVVDALTGETVWTKRIGQPTSYAWGISFDGTRLYAGDNSYMTNGGLYALDPATGQTLWHNGAMPCVPGPTQPADQCWSGYMATPSATPGILWLGAMDGQMRAFDSATGHTLWTYDTAHDVTGTNGESGHGGSIGPTNATIANGQVYIMSGYAPWTSRLMDGNIMYVFGLPGSQ